MRLMLLLITALNSMNAAALSLACTPGDTIVGEMPDSEIEMIVQQDTDNFYGIMAVFNPEIDGVHFEKAYLMVASPVEAEADYIAPIETQTQDGKKVFVVFAKKKMLNKTFFKFTYILGEANCPKKMVTYNAKIT